MSTKQAISSYPVKFAPILKERVWGGTFLPQMFSQSANAPIGEAWLLSGHPSSVSICSNGPYKGLPLVDLVNLVPEYKGELDSQFPILIKWLDCHEDLSIQIHPDDEYAAKVGELGKTESWYVVQTPEHGQVIYGHTFQNRQEYLDAVKHGRVPGHLTRREIHNGDLVHVPSRTVHALLSGTQVVEIQQSSDVTYRMYDWDRQPARALHIEEAGECMCYPGTLPTPHPVVADVRLDETPNGRRSLKVHSPYYAIEEIKGIRIGWKKAETNPEVLIIVDGEGVLVWDDAVIPVDRGDTFLIPLGIQNLELRSAHSPVTALRIVL